MGEANGLARDDERADRYLKAGEALLIEAGYDGFSIEAVARALGETPEAVCAEVGEKNEFIALIVRRASSGVSRIIMIADPEIDTTPAARLHRIAHIYLQAVFSRAAIRIYRIAANAANEHPCISIQFKASAASAMVKFAALLRTEIGITLPDGYTYEEAAGQFFALCRGGLHHLTLFDVDFRPSQREIEMAAWQGAETFLRAFPLRAHSVRSDGAARMAG